MKRKLFEWMTSFFVGVLQKANAMSVSVFERSGPVCKIGSRMGILHFFCPNRMTLWRAKTLFTKEPDTIQWIDNFLPTDIFYDIGANVGMYSIYAAAKGVKVFSFEPESQNYAVLNRNVYLNGAQNKVDAFNIALSDETRLGHLFINEFTIGGALNNFGDNLNYKKDKFEPGFKQGVASFTLDELITHHQLPVPTHIKIDVDGLESAIITGAKKLLQHPQLKTVLIELNTQLETDKDVIGVLEKNGFRLASCYCAPELDNSGFKGIYNHIFVRG